MDLVKNTGFSHISTQPGDALPGYFLTDSLLYGDNTLALTSAAVEQAPYSINLRSDFKVRLLGATALLTIWDGLSYVYYPDYSLQSVLQETDPSGIVVTVGESVLVTLTTSVGSGTVFRLTDQNNFSFYITII